MKDLVEAQADYIKFLEKEISKLESLNRARTGRGADNATIKKGRTYRLLIKRLKKKK
jgi:hypothetical protein